MRSIIIYKRYFYNSDCYKSARKQKQCGVQVHSTGANNPYLSRYVQPDDGLLGKNKYGNDSNRSGTNVCASAYIGKQSDGTVAIYQTLPWDYQCWLSGKGDNGNANKLGYIGFEICEDSLNDREYFNEAVLRLSVNLTAYLLNMIGASPDSIVAKFNKDTAISVMDHHELRDIGLASNHEDINHWLKKYGMTMDSYRMLVTEAMNEGVEATYVDCDASNATTENVLFVGVATPTGAYLNVRQSKSTGAPSIYKLYRGDEVDVIDDSDSLWWKVICPDQSIGYAMTQSGNNVWLSRKQDNPIVEAWTVTITGLSKSDADNIVSSYPNAKAERVT